MRTAWLAGAALFLACQGTIEDGTGMPPPGWHWDGGYDGPDSGVDAGRAADDGGLDAGTVEPVDAGFDAGPPDAGPPDAGPVDAGPVDAGPPALRQSARPLGSTDAGNGFYEYLPPGYGDGALRPLLVFWHGVGENGNGGSDLARVLANGPPKLINQNRWSNGWPFVVLSPQHAGGGCPGNAEIRDFIAWGAAHYLVDPKRLYLTGLSCGAIGSWGYLGEQLDAQVAAAVLVCGDPGPVAAGYSAWGRNQCNLGKVPIWSFHGDADPTVNIGNDRDTMTNLIACPQPPRQDAQFTVYPGVGHDSWSRTYDLSAGHDIYTWLLQQKKP
jgi:predicted esterase